MSTILLVEDDDYKAADLCRIMDECLGSPRVTKALSVTSALRRISSESFDLVVLDMSLPTFDLSGPGGGGSPQSQGGIEVLRLAKRLGAKMPFIVVTQYPDVEFDGLEVPLVEASEKLSARFKADVIRCIAYEFDGGNWRVEFEDSLLMAAAMEQARD